MKTISIHQPGYLPWPGYFEKIAQSDLHVVLDDVQFEKNSFDNRNKIRMPEGWIWLTVPVLTKGKFGANRLKDVEIDPRSGWNRKHWKSLCLHYSKTPYFAEHAPFFETVYAKGRTRLTDMNMEIIFYLLKAFGISTPLVFASEIQKEGVKSELILDICKSLGAGTYLSGMFGKDYLEIEKFRRENIRVIFQEYESPIYSQNYPGFVPNLSALDLLFNEGPRSLDILMHRVPNGGLIH